MTLQSIIYENTVFKKIPVKYYKKSLVTLEKIGIQCKIPKLQNESLHLIPCFLFLVFKSSHEIQSGNN
jgi:hypothetical protein